MTTRNSGPNMSQFDNITTTTTTTTTLPPQTPPLSPSLPSPEKQTPSLHPQNQKSKLPKRIKVTDESGWTHIIRGSKAQRKQSYIQPTMTPPHLLKPQEVAEKYMNSVEKACIRLKGFTSDWEESECREKMEEMMEKDVLNSDKVKIGNCVCLGLGSLTGVNGSKSSWYELVTLIWILKILGKFLPIWYYTYKHTLQPIPPSSPPIHISPPSFIPFHSFSPFYHVFKKEGFFFFFLWPVSLPRSFFLNDFFLFLSSFYSRKETQDRRCVYARSTI